jgi:hypothetical protein
VAAWGAIVGYQGLSKTWLFETKSSAILTMTHGLQSFQAKYLCLSTNFNSRYVTHICHHAEIMQKLKVEGWKSDGLGLNQSATVIAKKGAKRAFNSHCSLLEALFSHCSRLLSFPAPSDDSGSATGCSRTTASSDTYHRQYKPQQCSFDPASSNYKAGVSASALIEAA